MNLCDFHNEYCGLLPTAFQNLGKFQLVPRSVSQPDELEQLITDWKPQQGWISRQSKVQVFTGPVEMDNGPGHIIAAEFSRSGTSLHVRQKADRWVVSEAAEGAGIDVIIEPLTFVTDKFLVPEKPGLLYHRYWVLQDDCPKQHFAGFQGFVSLDGVNT